MPFFLHVSDENFEIIILFKKVQISDIRNSEVDIASKSPGENVVSYPPAAYKIFIEEMVVYTLEGLI
jgi:hypothetical protein